jgi:hypothetical protein
VKIFHGFVNEKIVSGLTKLFELQNRDKDICNASD